VLIGAHHKVGEGITSGLWGSPNSEIEASPINAHSHKQAAMKKLEYKTPSINFWALKKTAD
jgi:hypothetical protein